MKEKTLSSQENSSLIQLSNVYWAFTHVNKLSGDKNIVVISTIPNNEYITPRDGSKINIKYHGEKMNVNGRGLLERILRDGMKREFRRIYIPDYVASSVIHGDKYYAYEIDSYDTIYRYVDPFEIKSKNKGMLVNMDLTNFAENKGHVRRIVLHDAKDDYIGYTNIYGSRFSDYTIDIKHVIRDLQGNVMPCNSDGTCTLRNKWYRREVRSYDWENKKIIYKLTTDKMDLEHEYLDIVPRDIGNVIHSYELLMDFLSTGNDVTTTYEFEHIINTDIYLRKIGRTYVAYEITDTTITYIDPLVIKKMLGLIGGNTLEMAFKKVRFDNEFRREMTRLNFSVNDRGLKNLRLRYDGSFYRYDSKLKSLPKLISKKPDGTTEISTTIENSKKDRRFGKPEFKTVTLNGVEMRKKLEDDYNMSTIVCEIHKKFIPTHNASGFYVPGKETKYRFKDKEDIFASYDSRLDPDTDLVRGYVVYRLLKDGSFALMKVNKRGLIRFKMDGTIIEATSKTMMYNMMLDGQFGIFKDCNTDIKVIGHKDSSGKFIEPFTLPNFVQLRTGELRHKKNLDVELSLKGNKYKVTKNGTRKQEYIDPIDTFVFSRREFYQYAFTKEGFQKHLLINDMVSGKFYNEHVKNKKTICTSDVRFVPTKLLDKRRIKKGEKLRVLVADTSHCGYFNKDLEIGNELYNCFDNGSILKKTKDNTFIIKRNTGTLLQSYTHKVEDINSLQRLAVKGESRKGRFKPEGFTKKIPKRY